MRVDQFDFDLPAELIANRPVSPRDSARLLLVTPRNLADLSVRDLLGLVHPGDVMVFNDTRVIPARLLGQRGVVTIEVLLHRAIAADQWEVFARPAKRLKPGQPIEFQGALRGEVLSKSADGLVMLRFNASGPQLMSRFEAVGHIPLPPYIRRADDARDRADYQTIYAAKNGAVAAPTAGLHFTPDLLAQLDERGVKRVSVTLHVGAGTFLPVKTEDTDDHVMHAEIGEISPDVADLINSAKARGGRVIAVGTTSLRLLESAVDDRGRLAPFSGDTRLFITPGYRFQAVDVLMTNFHLPRSTLFMLVSAFAGLERMKSVYAHAIASRYRFYSYGDASWLERSPAS
ncbi:MAG: tRNA preQ1(34) S-adenosylmethionine ribosyltransferase-isomerase QueA [Rhodospirillaceae bacterium]|nr:tRNA preQ1(34) S-adenosylmethionine ribosyltransferase-isomerase QueA [Rhodospirillaceae bacterium]